MEHVRHVGHRRDVPEGNILIEGRGAPEHAIHVSHRRGVPRGDVLIEGRGAPEHAIHVNYRRGVPRAKGLVERRGIVKHMTHVVCRGYVPGGDVSVEGRGAGEHPGHVGDARQVGDVGRRVYHVGGSMEGRPHCRPGRVAPPVNRHELVRVGAAFQRDGFEAVDRNRVGAGVRVDVGHGPRDVGGAGAVAPVDGHTETPEGDGDGLVDRVGLPRGDEREPVGRLLGVCSRELSREGGAKARARPSVGVAECQGRQRR